MKSRDEAWWGIAGWGQGRRAFEPLKRLIPLAGAVSLLGHDAPAADETLLRQPTLEGWAQDLLAQLPQNQRLNLCGWSLGGMAALTAAAMAPERVARVAVIGTGVVFGRSERHPTGATPEVLREFELGAADPARLLKRFFALATWGMERESAKAIGRQVLPHNDDFIPTTQTLNAGLEILKASNLESLAPRVRTPVLVLHGMRDRVCHPDLGQSLAGALGKTTEVVMALHGQAGHAPHWSHPQWVGDALNSFAQTY